MQENNPQEPTRRWTHAFWFVVKAIEIRLRFVVVLVGIGLIIGYWDTLQNYWDKWTRPSAVGKTSLSSSEVFYCPMHPKVVRDHLDPDGAIPKCPICGMPLSKRGKSAAAEVPEGVLSRRQYSPYRIQLAGIRTEPLVRRPLTLDIRTVGTVAIDERRLSRIVIRTAGYVEKLYVNESFVVVREGDPLAEIYSPELYAASQEFLISQRSQRLGLADMAREKLILLGIDAKEIDELAQDGQARPRLVLRSPHGGHVFTKPILTGDSVQAGQTLFEVADLSTVWIEADVYEKDASMLHTGQTVEASLEAYPGRMFHGRLHLIHPHVTTATRTLRVRFELENPDHLLRPGMFATIRLKTPMQQVEPFASQLAEWKKLQDEQATSATGVPPAAAADAAADGAAADGAAADGAAADGAAADGAAADGAAADGETLIAAQKLCPVTGAKLGSMGDPVRATATGHTLYLCCTGCQGELDARPEHYRSRLQRVTEEGVLAVPELAVIDTGDQQVVYVEREPGLFDGVEVTLGRPADGYYPVIDGLLVGDRVVAAGAFLVDAETRLNPAAASAYFGASGTPAGGGDSSTPTDEPSDSDRRNLAKLPAADRRLAEKQAICPVTGKPLGSMGVPHKLDVGGKTLFVCCRACESQVRSDPEAAWKAIEQRAATPQSRQAQER
jgi:membrane fusion protein, copper/silver efflux system